MAIFNHGDNAPAAAGGSTTIVTDGAAFKGELNLECDLFVDGEFEGKIMSAKSVTIGKNGRVKGELKAEHLRVQGAMEGDVDVQSVEITATGTLRGSLVSVELSIEPKGVFEGESRIRKSETPDLEPDT